MESSQSRSHLQVEPRPEQVCPQCGRTFRPHLAASDGEELCDFCYDAESQPVSHGAKSKSAARRAGAAQR